MDEVEVVRTVQTNLVVLVPGMGDDIQAIKAGVLEIADILVVNKADRPGASDAFGDPRRPARWGAGVWIMRPRARAPGPRARRWP